ncbi:MAG: cation diffusion facilitator family transporter [Candidatus Omnitrophota bacterium]|nr:MAG: cation diffusion facilitator family transporter [Candidatus Omnitrophota bacterium]
MKDNFYSPAFKICWLSILANFFIALIKFTIGFFSNSISILSDGAHSLGDLFTSIIVIFSLKVSKRPADSVHPFGHGRAEDVGGLILSLALIIIGFAFLKDSFLRLFSPEPVKINLLFISIVSVAAVVKLILGRFTQNISRRISSPILEIDAFHHYSDFFTSIAVVAGLFFIRRGVVYVDSIIGMGVSIVIIVWGLTTGREFISKLMGKKEPVAFYEKVRQIASSFPFVEGVHDIEVHSYGENKVIFLHVEMSPSFSLEEAHSVADNIEKKIYQSNLGRCIVHIDLKGTPAAVDKKELERLMSRISNFTKDIKGFHDMKILSTEAGTIVNFHLLLEKNVSLEESHILSHRLAAFLKEKFNFSQVNIHIEPYERNRKEGGRE